MPLSVLDKRWIKYSFTPVLATLWHTYFSRLFIFNKSFKSFTITVLDSCSQVASSPDKQKNVTFQGKSVFEEREFVLVRNY